MSRKSINTLLIFLLFFSFAHSQTTDVTIINFLTKERTPALISDYFGRVKTNHLEIEVFKDSTNIYGNSNDGVMITYKKSGSGYLFINQTIEKSINHADKRKVEYFLNKEVVNDCKTIKKLVKLKKGDVLSINIDNNENLTFISVFVEIKK